VGYPRRRSAYHHLVLPQVFTGAVPFNDRRRLAAVVTIMGGERPPRPTDPSCTDGLWVLMGRCWHQDPRLRPRVSEVFKGLRGSWILSFLAIIHSLASLFSRMQPHPHP